MTHDLVTIREAARAIGCPEYVLANATRNGTIETHGTRPRQISLQVSRRWVYQSMAKRMAKLSQRQRRSQLESQALAAIAQAAGVSITEAEDDALMAMASISGSDLMPPPLPAHADESARWQRLAYVVAALRDLFPLHQSEKLPDELISGENLAPLVLYLMCACDLLVMADEIKRQDKQSKRPVKTG